MPPVEIVFLDRDSLPVPLPFFDFEHSLTSYPATRRDEVVARCLQADVVITNKVAVDGALLAQLPRLRMLAVAATGVNHIDLPACRERSVAVANVRHYGDETVAEHAFLLMLALLKNLPAYQRDMAEGCWPRAAQFCHFGASIGEASGRTLGIIGSGGIGQALAVRARAFGMNVVFAERKGAQRVRAGHLAFDELLACADVVSLHCPLTAETRDLIAAAELACMKPGAVLINTARGGLVNEADLLAALESGTIAGAGFDVLCDEPPRADNPLLQANLPQLMVTPHIAWASREAMARLALQLSDNIAAFLAGREQNRLV
jgi:glycerate dehydrogenase